MTRVFLGSGSPDEDGNTENVTVLLYPTCSKLKGVGLLAMYILLPNKN